MDVNKELKFLRKFKKKKKKNRGGGVYEEVKLYRGIRSGAGGGGWLVARLGVVGDVQY